MAHYSIGQEYSLVGLGQLDLTPVQRYKASKLGVGAHQVLGTWAKFEAPSESSTMVTVTIPGVSEPFEDVPISP